jgi:hyperosmotically inducible periplasmic protein
MKIQVMRTATGLMMAGGLLFAATPARAAHLSSPVAGNTVGVAIDDGQLEDAIEKAWKADPKLSARKLDVAVDHGVATISGDVLNAAEKARAEKLAHVAGVTSVKSEIKINTDTRSTAEKATSAAKAGTEKAANKTAEGVGVAADKTGEAVGTAADKTKDAADKTASAASDTWITTKVKAKLTKDKGLKGSKVEVSTTGGTVMLSGTVTSEAQRTRAVTLAKGIKGVKDVDDKTTISPAGTL